MSSGSWLLLSGWATAAALWCLFPRVRLERLAVAPAAVQLPAWLQPRAEAMDSGTRGRVALAGGMGVGLLSGFSVEWALLLCAVVAAAVYVVLGRLEPSGVRRSREELIEQLPYVLDLLTVTLQAGLPLRRAARRVAESSGGAVATLLAPVFARLDMGFSDSEAWAVLGEHRIIGPLARELSRSAHDGTAVAMTVERFAAGSRRAATTQRTARVKEVGVNSLAPVTMCFLPAFVLLGLVPAIAVLAQQVFR